MSLPTPPRGPASSSLARALAAAFLVLGAPFAAAQTVSTLSLDAPHRMDGLYVDDEGVLYATSGFTGGDVYRVSAGGAVDTFATGVGGPIHVLKTSDGRFLVTDFREGEVSEVQADGTVRVVASVKDGPADLAEGPDGSVYVTHYGDPNGAVGDGDSVTRIRPDGTVEDFAVGGSLNGPVGVAVDDAGNLYAANIIDGRITKIAPDGSQTPFASLPSRGSLTIGHLVWASGRLYATHLSNHQVVAFDPDGTMGVVAGTGQPGRSDGSRDEGTFLNPNGIAASVTGDTLYVSEYLLSSEFVPLPTDRLRVIDLSRATPTEPGARGATGLKILGGAPNPFSTSTRVSFELGAAAEVSLVAYDVLGREVDAVAEGPYSAGQHEVRWSPSSLPAGLYVLRLQSGGEQAVLVTVYRP